MNKYHLRRAGVSDIPEMQKVITIAMNQYARDSNITTVLDALGETATDLEKHIIDDYFLLAFMADKLVGTIRVSRIASGEAYISRFTVLPDMQKLGVGSILFKAAEEYIRISGYRCVSLHTALSNRHLVRFYAQRDFKLAETKTDRGYARGTFIKHY